MLCQRN